MGLAAGCDGGLLGRFEVVFEGLGLGHECYCLGDLGIPFGADLEAFELAELRGEELTLDALLDPVVDACDVSIGVVDGVVFQEFLELLHNGIVHLEVLCYGVSGEVVFAEVEKGVVRDEGVLKVIGLEIVDLLSGVMPPPP